MGCLQPVSESANPNPETLNPGGGGEMGNVYDNPALCVAGPPFLGLDQAARKFVTLKCRTSNLKVWAVPIRWRALYPPDPKTGTPKDAYGLWLQCNYLLAC